MDAKELSSFNKGWQKKKIEELDNLLYEVQQLKEALIKAQKAYEDRVCFYNRLGV